MKELLSTIDNAEIKQEIKDEMAEHQNNKHKKATKVEIKKTKKEVQTRLK
jgi:hypothetical protein